MWEKSPSSRHRYPYLDAAGALVSRGVRRMNGRQLCVPSGYPATRRIGPRATRRSSRKFSVRRGAGVTPRVIQAMWPVDTERRRSMMGQPRLPYRCSMAGVLMARSIFAGSGRFAARHLADLQDAGVRDRGRSTEAATLANPLRLWLMASPLWVQKRGLPAGRHTCARTR